MLQLAVYTVASQTFNAILFLQLWTNNLPAAIVKHWWRRFKPACVFKPSHQGVAFKNRMLIGVDLRARYTLIALTPTWDAESNLLAWWICSHGREAREKQSVHRPQLQRGRIILCSSVTTGDGTLIRQSLYCMMICVNTLCRSYHLLWD